ncbi:hypothetical protein F0562_002799 [Nyssa sinensis]|uniref:Uncharacterized protein n=1 Tax=Nyssa sinensis TaxID=561372 RepID=A0A5J5BXV0_9ASTE|nr:hypothetical protein F0562_002799 [Nyssa sinensis]
MKSSPSEDVVQLSSGEKTKQDYSIQIEGEMQELNPGAGMVRAKAIAEAAAVQTKAEPRCRESLIPKKRKLVKKMMIEYIIQSIASCLRPATATSSSSCELTLINNKQHACKIKKKIFPFADGTA